MTTPAITTTASPYTFVTQQICLYVGIPILILGIIGGIMNLIVFLSLKTFRQSSCAFFLTIMSAVNIGQLLTGLLSRIMISGFSTDWTENSVGYCKFRIACLQICALMSYTCLCFATIDQFMATSLHPRWQQLLNIKKAYVLCISAGIVWILHSIPALVWFDLNFSTRTGRFSCTNVNPYYQKYYTYVYVLILAGLLPMIINIFFGSLAYWNVRQIPYRAVPLVRRELDKQLTGMVLTQVMFSVSVILPYVTILFLLNTLDVSSSSINGPLLNFLNFASGMLYYLHFAVR